MTTTETNTAATEMGESEIRRVIHELRTYDPIADEYKGAHIHGVWARELESALAAQPAPVDEPDKDYDSEGSGYYQCLIDVEKGIQELALSMGWDTDSSAYEVSKYIDSFPVPEKYWKGAHLRYKQETTPTPATGSGGELLAARPGGDDTRRLDALERLLNQQADEMLLLHNGRGVGKGIVGLGLRNTGRSLRKAIDDATAAHPAQAGGEDRT